MLSSEYSLPDYTVTIRVAPKSSDNTVANNP